MGKDAVAGEIVDGAACVADLADLADLDQDVIANLELRAQGECEQVDSLGGEVLSKIALVHIESARLRRLDRFCGQKRDLAVPMPGMRIGGESKLLDDGIVPIGDGRLARALVRRCIDRDDAAGSGVGIGGGAQRAVVFARSESSRLAASMTGLLVGWSWGTRAPFDGAGNMLNPTTKVGSLPDVVHR